MRIYRLAVLALLISTVAQAAFAAKAPDWLNGTSKKYPSNKFLIGIGLGQGIDAARSNARAEIAKIFQTRITQYSQETTRESSLSNGANLGFQLQNNNELSIKTSTEDMLRGVEIAETYLDRRNKTYYALAVLDKGMMRRNLSSEQADLEGIISASVYAEHAESPILAVRAWTGVLNAMDKRDELLIKRRVVDSASLSDSESSNITRGDVERKRQDAASRVLFSIDSASPEASAAVNERITSMGFKISTSTGTSDLQYINVALKIDTLPVERYNQKWKFCNWSAFLEIRDRTAGDRIVAAVTRQGQVSHINDSAAREKASGEAVRALSIAAEQQISQYIFGK